ncbi:hypothetical protein ACJZ2D_000931 [Fusarium nematophilum]
MSAEERLDELQVKLDGEKFDLSTFEQILEMDDDDDREFSRSIVYGFFEQSESTIVEMEDALVKEDLPKLAALGHFIRGSASTLGAVKIREDADRIKKYGSQLDEDGARELDSTDCLDKIRDILPSLKANFHEVEQALREFYKDSQESK